MKELKFRVWSKTKKSWLNSCVVGNNGTPFLFYVKVDDKNVVHNMVYTIKELDPIIQQYTGCIDKNGKEIYEGDLVKTEEGNIFQVGFDDGSYTLIIDGGEDYHTLAGSISFHWKLEIIGNIFENKK